MKFINRNNAILVMVIIAIALVLTPAAASAASTTNVSISQASSSGDTIMYNILVDNGDQGVGIYTDLSVSIEDSSVAEITSVSDKATPGTTSDKTIASDGSTATWSSGGPGTSTTTSGQIKIAQVRVQSKNKGTTTLNVTGTSLMGDNFGSPYTIEEYGSTSITVGDTSPKSITLSEASTSSGQITYNIRLKGAKSGVGTFTSLKFKSTDASVAEITDIRAIHGGGTASKTIANGGSSATLSGGLSSSAGTSSSPKFAEVVVKTTPGTATVSVTSIGTIGTQDGTSYSVASLGSENLDIGGKGPIFNKKPSEDLDNDGKVEDLNGNNKVTALDAQTLYDSVNKIKTSGKTSRFDYNGNGRITALDAQAMYDEVT